MLVTLALFGNGSASSLPLFSTANPGADLPNQPADIGEFVAFCPFSHRLNDDPVVLPNMSGMSHSHDFMGNVSVVATSTLETLLTADTTCDPLSDRSAYWVPTLYTADNQIIPIEHATMYYTVSIDDEDSLQPFPVGLTIIAGRSISTTPPAESNFTWSCLGEAISSTSDFVICPAHSKLEVLLNFPDCWDGVHLDSIDHKSHMAYSSAQACPASHPIPVPRLQYKLRYATTGSDGMKLSSGPAFTMHGDFMNAWEVDALANRMNCLYTLTKCGVNGYPDDAPAATVTPSPTSEQAATATATPTNTPSATIPPATHTPIATAISTLDHQAYLPIIQR